MFVFHNTQAGTFSVTLSFTSKNVHVSLFITSSNPMLYHIDISNKYSHPTVLFFLLILLSVTSLVLFCLHFISLSPLPEIQWNWRHCLSYSNPFSLPLFLFYSSNKIYKTEDSLYWSIQYIQGTHIYQTSI